MAELKKTSVKSKVEAIIFSTGHRISLDGISKLSRSRREEVSEALKELQKEYDEKQSSLMLVEEGDFWKFTVRDHLIPIVRRIVTETELTKSVMETLAVIAFKYPILQSDLIKMRTNKAYDHLVELEKSGYITRQKHSRTNLIKLTEKFFRYFDLTEEKLKERFMDFDSIAKAIKEKESEVEKIKEEQRKKAEDIKHEDEKIKKEIESLDEAGEEFKVPLESYNAGQKGIVSEELGKEGNLLVEKQFVGNLEVVVVDDNQKPQPRNFKPDVIGEEHSHEKPHSQPKEIPENVKAAEHHEEKLHHERKKSEGIKLAHDMDSKVDDKVNEMLGIKENKDEGKEKDNGV